MREDLDLALCRDFPHVFAERDGDMRVTAMCWGFPGDGWEPIIRKAAAKLEPLIVAALAADPSGHVTSSQVKEKYGTLRWYMSSSTVAMDKIIRAAERKSAKTCETCGKLGKLRGTYWVFTACAKCAKEKK